ILPQDLLRFGLIPEFVGRIPIIATLNSLDEDALIDILVKPKNALAKQYQKLFEIDGVKLEFDEKALKAIAKKTIERETGARGLRAIIEEIMLDVMYEVPSRDDVEKCIITEDTVVKSAEPTLVHNESIAKKKALKGTKKDDPEEGVS